MNARGDFRQILKTHLHTSPIVVRMLCDALAYYPLKALRIVTMLCDILVYYPLSFKGLISPDCIAKELPSMAPEIEISCITFLSCCNFYIQAPVKLTMPHNKIIFLKSPASLFHFPICLLKHVMVSVSAMSFIRSETEFKK